MSYTAPHHTIQYHTSLHFTTPHYTSPHLTTLYHTTLHITAPHHTSQHFTTPHYTTPHLTTPRHTTSRHTTPLHTTYPPHITLNQAVVRSVLFVVPLDCQQHQLQRVLRRLTREGIHWEQLKDSHGADFAPHEKSIGPEACVTGHCPSSSTLWPLASSIGRTNTAFVIFYMPTQSKF